MKLRTLLSSFAATAVATASVAAPAKYEVDASHTYPSFEADHMGVSTWRGKINSTSGTITLDKEGKSGAVELKMDMASIDFGHDKMNEHAKAKDLLDVATYPTATYTGKLVDFKNGAPTAVDGTLELHGVKKPVKLTINKFTCIIHPRLKKEVCGADASGAFSRDDFGVSLGKEMGFNMDVKLAIQIEARVAD